MWFEGLAASELIEELSVRIFEPGFSKIRSQVLTRLPTELRNVMLFLDFDTEVSMEGILGFLENSTGEFLSETIEMFIALPAPHNAEILKSIRGVMERYGISSSGLQNDFSGHEEFEITSFRKLHGERATAMAKEVDLLSAGLYLHRAEDEDVCSLVEQYVADHRGEIVEALRTLGI